MHNTKPGGSLCKYKPIGNINSLPSPAMLHTHKLDRSSRTGQEMPRSVERINKQRRSLHCTVNPFILLPVFSLKKNGLQCVLYMLFVELWMILWMNHQVMNRMPNWITGVPSWKTPPSRRTTWSQPHGRIRSPGTTSHAIMRCN